MISTVDGVTFRSGRLNVINRLSEDCIRTVTEPMVHSSDLIPSHADFHQYARSVLCCTQTKRDSAAIIRVEVGIIEPPRRVKKHEKLIIGVKTKFSLRFICNNKK